MTKVPIQILFENESLVAVNKSSGVNFHCESEKIGLFESVRQQLEIQLWPVHRLDKATSGVILFAKSAKDAAKIGALFEKRLVSKVYLALSDRKPKKKQGEIIGDMSKARSGSWKLNRKRDNPAITTFFSQSISPGIRLFYLQPKTGKTHQLRVAMKSLGAPILGDTRYQGSDSDRCYLHALSISLVWNHQTLFVSAPPQSGKHFMSIDESLFNLL